MLPFAAPDTGVVVAAAITVGDDPLFVISTVPMALMLFTSCSVATAVQIVPLSLMPTVVDSGLPGFLVSHERFVLLVTVPVARDGCVLSSCHFFCSSSCPCLCPSSSTRVAITPQPSSSRVGTQPGSVLFFDCLSTCRTSWQSVRSLMC